MLLNTAMTCTAATASPAVATTPGIVIAIAFAFPMTMNPPAVPTTYMSHADQNAGERSIAFVPTSERGVHVRREAPFGSGAFQSAGGNRRSEPSGTRTTRNRTPMKRNVEGTPYALIR